MYYIHDTDPSYRAWLFNTEHWDQNIDIHLDLKKFSGELVKLPHDRNQLPCFALKFPSESHALWFKLRYS